VLDEPSIGLHQRDNERLVRTLHRLRDLGNTVLVVEHDEATMESADWIVDFGPGAGRHGGKVVAEGTPEDVKAVTTSITGNYLAGRERIEVPTQRRAPSSWVKLSGAREHNLKNVTAEIPLGVMVAVTGVSGAGKSSLINATLHPALNRMLHRSMDRVGPYDELTGLGKVDKAIVIDQQPIGRTPRSNPATYTKAFDLIRELYAQMPQAKTYGYQSGRFSFNVSAKQGGGRCEACARSRCTFSRTCSSRARCAKAAATTTPRCGSSTRARTSRRSSRPRSRKRPRCSSTTSSCRGSWTRSSTSASATSRSASRRRRYRAVKRSA
jgi:excinuclease ABC subunit A